MKWPFRLDRWLPGSLRRGQDVLQADRGISCPPQKSDSRALIDQAIGLERKGRISDAWLLLHEAHAGLGRDWKLSAIYARYYRKLGRYEECRRMLATLDYDRCTDSIMAIEMASTLLALKRSPEALDELRMLGSPLIDPAVAALFINCATRAGDVALAISTGAEAARLWPDDLKIASRRVESALAAGQPEAAWEILATLPADRSDTVVIRKVKATILFRMEAWADADAIYSSLIDEDVYDGGIVSGKIRSATERGISEQDLRALAARLDAAIAAGPNTKWSKLHMRIDLAARIGDWDAVLALSDALFVLNPTDLFVHQSRARAHFALGDLSAAKSALATFLKREPANQHALELSAELSLADGHPEFYLKDLEARVIGAGGKDTKTGLLLVRSLFMIDRAEEAKRYLAMCRSAAADLSHTALKTELLLQGEDVADVIGDDAEPFLQRSRPTVTEQELRELLNYGDNTLFTGRYTAVALAWSLYRGEPMERSSWVRQAVQASRSRKLISSMSRESASLGMVDPPDLELLNAYIANGRPFILAMSHFGPPVEPALLQYIPGLHYVANDDGPPVKGAALISGVTGANNVAVGIYQALRRGAPVVMSPDSPAAMMRRGKAGGHAQASLFGIECPILNTIPKFSRDMNIPSFWLQTRWRGDRIIFELAALPIARPGEAPQSWYARWAEAYMAHVTDIMTSSPRNQNLNAPLWRYLLLRGAGALAKQ